jgi:hypothetical protein
VATAPDGVDHLAGPELGRDQGAARLRWAPGHQRAQAQARDRGRARDAGQVQQRGGHVHVADGIRNAQATRPADQAIPFQILDFQLAQGVQATGIRVRAGAGGTQTFVTCCELDALSPPVPPPRPSFDRNDDGRLDVEDLHAWEAAPADLDGDGVIDAVDRTIMAHSVRFREVSDLLFQRP